MLGRGAREAPQHPGSTFLEKGLANIRVLTVQPVLLDMHHLIPTTTLRGRRHYEACLTEQKTEALRLCSCAGVAQPVNAESGLPTMWPGPVCVVC